MPELDKVYHKCGPKMKLSVTVSLACMDHS